MEKIDIDKLAELARIEMSDEEKKDLEKDVESILGYVTQVQEVVVNSEEEPEVGSVFNVMREDSNPHEPGEYSDDLLQEVPSKVTKDGKTYVKVKDIL